MLERWGIGRGYRGVDGREARNAQLTRRLDAKLQRPHEQVPKPEQHVDGAARVDDAEVAHRVVAHGRDADEGGGERGAGQEVGLEGVALLLRGAVGGLAEDGGDVLY